MHSSNNNTSSNNKGFFSSLYNKVKESSKGIWHNISSLWQNKQQDQAISINTTQLMKNLLAADISQHTAQKIIKNINQKHYTETQFKELLAENIAQILQDKHRPLVINPNNQPTVIFMIGSNGTGKTLTTVKLAYKMQQENKRVLLCAADSFRAAAATQLQNLAQKISCPCFVKDNKNPSAIIYDAVVEAINQHFDVLIVDTAGRLHNNQNLIMELQKSFSVINKINPNLWVYSIIVLDANTGQNNLAQLKSFSMQNTKQGIIMTKLDGTACGGTLVEIAQEFDLPIYGLGYGERIQDLYELNAKLLSRALCGLPMSSQTDTANN